jgi:hypothetical protein
VKHDVYLQHAQDIGQLLEVKDHGTDQIASVSLNIPALWLLVRYVYAFKLKAHIRDRELLPEYAELREISLQKLKRKVCHCLPECDIEATFRRVRWVLLYILNGSKRYSHHPCLHTQTPFLSREYKYKGPTCARLHGTG